MVGRTVAAADGRTWTVRREIVWRHSPEEDDLGTNFESGLRAFLLIISALLALWIMLRYWIPDWTDALRYVLWATVPPLLIFAPARWLILRPWDLSAETLGGYDLPPESWSGKVRGRGRAKREIRLIVRSLRTRATPIYYDSPLHPTL